MNDQNIRFPADYSKSQRLFGKVAIITGASRGIGAASARVFAQQGANVVLAARNKEALEKVAIEIQKIGVKALSVPTDVGDPDSVKNLVEQAMTTFGRLDVAFNNAGESHRQTPLADVSIDDFDKTIRVHLRGVFLSMKFEIPAMLAGGGGSIVNTSSTAGLMGVHGLADYVAAKHGIIGLTKTAALDYAKNNIRVNVITPGSIMNERIRQAGKVAEEQINRAVPLKRIGQPEEIGALVAWLCSDEADYITGSVITIDGGILAGVA